MEATASESRREEVWLALGTAVAFAGVALLALWHHEMWRDEAQAWLIARDSASLAELWRNLRYEGHPLLWYLLLYPLTRLTHNPLAMQLLNVAIGTATAFLFAWRAPFTRLQRILFAFGYFPLFEYGVIARGYGLGVLLVTISCIAFSRRQRFTATLAGLVALMANTSFHTLVVAVSLAMGWLAARVDRRAILAIVIVFVGVALGVAQNLRPPYAHNTRVLDVQDQPRHHIDVRRAGRVVGLIWKAYIPVPSLTTEHFWDTNVLSADLLIGQLARVALSAALLCAVCVVLMDTPPALLAYAIGTATLLAFAYFKMLGDMRHYGHLFILVIACLWLRRTLRQAGAGVAWRTWLERWFLYGVLGAQMVGAAVAVGRDWVAPFSAGREASTLMMQMAGTGPVIADTEFNVSPLCAYADRTVYLPRLGREGSFAIENGGASLPATRAEIAAAVRKLAGSGALTIATSYPLSDVPGVVLQERGRFLRNIVMDEPWYLYSATPAAAR